MNKASVSPVGWPTRVFHSMNSRRCSTKSLPIASVSDLRVLRLTRVVFKHDRLRSTSLQRRAASSATRNPVDTPWRFKTPKKLWIYCGVGLRRTTSGTGKDGKGLWN
jgi:hypothetical protein